MLGVCGGAEPRGRTQTQGSQVPEQDVQGRVPQGTETWGSHLPPALGTEPGDMQGPETRGTEMGDPRTPAYSGARAPGDTDTGGPPWPPPWGGTRTLSPRGQGGPGLPPRTAAASPDVRGNRAMTSPDTATAKSRQGLR